MREMRSLTPPDRSTSYEVAAAAKMCAPDTVFDAVRDGALTGTIRRVLWDDAFFDWKPRVTSSEVMDALRPYRYWSKSIVPCSSFREATRMMRLRAQNGGPTDAICCPAPHWAIRFLHSLQDGPDDGQPSSCDSYSDELHASALAGQRYFQIRSRSDTSGYGRSSRFSSLITTEEALLRVMGSKPYQSALESGKVRELPHYCGARLVAAKNLTRALMAA